MRVKVIPIKELSEDLKQRWLEIQSSNPNLSGPCFHPELFVSVGKFCPDVYVSLLHNGKDLCGFFPFRKDRGGLIAKAIEFCDYEAIISSPHQYWNVDEILKKSGLSGWQFNSIVDFKNLKITDGNYKIILSLRADLTGGFEKYQTSLKNGRIKDRELSRQLRVLQRTIGPIRYIPVCSDIEVLRQALTWKTIRHNRDTEWEKMALGLLEYIYCLEEPSFSGALSALYVGDNLLAANFGIRYQGIMHGWMIAFNPNFPKYSPGIILLHYLLAQLDSLQCGILDFGRANSQYKHTLSNTSVPVMVGTVRTHTLKERIKPIHWIHRGIFYFVKTDNAN